MEQRTFDELISDFNSTISRWEIDLKYKFRLLGMIANIGYEHEKMLNNLPSVESEWNNHTVACLLAELFDDSCACNYCGIDEWLPEKCEVIDACPNPVGVACWEQFLTHRKENG